MKNNRPGGITLLSMASMSWPITAISSILHRITGVLLVALVPLTLWVLEKSLSSQADFNYVKSLLETSLAKFILWAILSMLAYHIIAGFRHIFMDAGIGESLEGGRLGAQLSIALGLISAVSLGVWIW